MCYCNPICNALDIHFFFLKNKTRRVNDNDMTAHLRDVISMLLMNRKTGTVIIMLVYN